MVCRALLARRSPPRLSRRRWVLPEEASTGLTPQSAAKDASLWRRSGLSPAVMSSAAAVSGPTPLRSSSRGACALSVSVIWRFRSSISVVSSRIRRASRARGVGGCGGGIARCAGVELGAAADQGGVAQPGQAVAQLRVGADEDRLELVDRL